MRTAFKAATAFTVKKKLMVIAWKAGVLAAVMFLAGSMFAGAAPAQAATIIAPPKITATLLGGIGPYPVGTPVTFTFSAGVVGTPVAYEYTLNGGPAETVSAPSGAASVQITPTRRTSYLTAYAVAADGTVSGGTLDIFYAFSPRPAADKDLNGDGAPDLLTVGGTTGLAPGLWLATGTKSSDPAEIGELAKSATDIGINGNGFNPGAGGPSDFNGAQAITGLFTGDGFQDVLIYYPSGNDAGGGAILAGSGDGSAIEPISGNQYAISSGILTDANGDNPLQVVNAYGSIYSTGLPDLLATSGDPVHGFYLNYYEEFSPGLFSQTFTIHTPTPDGTADWNQWTLATLQYGGSTGMFLWNQSTGALYLWAGVIFTDNGNGIGTIAYTQYRISANFNKRQPLPTLEAADFDGDGVPDLWAVTPGGVATGYQISRLSATGTAKVTAGMPQKLP